MLRKLLNSDDYWWLVYLATIAIFFLVVEIGYRIGRRRFRETDPEHKGQTGTVLAALLALLGFLLATSFATAADRFGQRKALVLDEANAVGTAFLRADFLPPEKRAEMRALFDEYVDVRLEGVRYRRIPEAVERSEEIHDEMWRRAQAAANQEPRSAPIALLIEALNEVIDLHAKRVIVALHFRIPPSLLWTLYLIAFLSFWTMGMHFGLSGTRNVIATFALVFSFSLVMLLIVDLDRPIQRLFEVTQDPLAKTHEAIEEALERDASRGNHAPR
jgi:hypothetical protein